MLLTSATAPLANAMIGGTYQPLDNGHAKIGIGDSSTAAAKAQTDLQASTNKLYKSMDATYPQISGSAVTFQVTAGSSEGNYVWNEFLISDGSPGTAWARFVQTMNGGTAKSSGQTWVLQVVATMGRNDAAN
jgi:hypothetical protein